jgi:hypothetical protein
MKGLKYISTYNAVKCSLIKLLSQADDNHAQADYNHDKADDRKVDLYSMEQRCDEMIRVSLNIIPKIYPDQITISGRRQPHPSRRQPRHSRRPQGGLVFNGTKMLCKD